MQVSRLKHRFKELKENGKKGLIPYITGGDPCPNRTVELMHALVSSGADIIELGVPFSDPIADGPVIQRASERALAKGICLKNCLDWVEGFRKNDDLTPIILMGYFNPIERFGLNNFSQRALEVGLDGILIVDCPPEELRDLSTKLSKKKIDTIYLVAPTTPEERIEHIVQGGSGYIYYVSLKGVTGANHLDLCEVTSRLKLIRKYSKLPIAVGFGISSKENVKNVANTIADGVIVGSALIKIMEKAEAERKCPIGEASLFMKGLSEAINEI